MVQAALLVFFTSISDILVTGFSSLDIYRSSDETWYIIFNPTVVEIFENCILIICYYILR